MIESQVYLVNISTETDFEYTIYWYLKGSNSYRYMLVNAETMQNVLQFCLYTLSVSSAFQISNATRTMYTCT